MPQPASALIEDGVIDVLKNVSRRPIEPTLASDLVADLGFDSLQILEVIAELEDRFDISIPLNDVPATRTVAQVVAQVARLVEERSNSLMADCARCPRRWPHAARADAGYCFVAGERRRLPLVRRASTRRRCASPRALARGRPAPRRSRRRSSSPTPKRS